MGIQCRSSITDEDTSTREHVEERECLHRVTKGCFQDVINSGYFTIAGSINLQLTLAHTR